MPELKDERAWRAPGYMEAIAEALSTGPFVRRCGPIIVLRDDIPGRTVVAELWKGTLPEHGIHVTIRAGSPSDLRDQLIAYLRGEVPILKSGDRARVVIPSLDGRLRRGTIVLIMASHGLALDEVAFRTEDGTVTGRICVEQLDRIE